MLKIVTLDIVDLIAFPSGVLFVIKEKLENESIKVSFYSFDVATKSIATVTKNAYLLSKFGTAFSPIAKQLGDYVSCDTAKLWNGQTFIIYSTGEMGIFDEGGKLISTGDLTYRDAPARDVAIDNNYIWSVVPKQNLIIKYSLLQNRVVMRIGGDNATTFTNPVSIEEYDGYLYVCCKDTCKIKRVRLSDFAVDEYKEFDEPVFKFLKVGSDEFVVLESGVYLL
ncbi:MAG: hypothetical protein IJK02_05810 [Clostridia bacterium]|nr:hypothetical protein [Clostridia bacterium]MBR0510538.1 hypothetical protein [Clostridia bacterium]MBR0537282.1 hypothetical protein [Clostridia bacterium]